MYTIKDQKVKNQKNYGVLMFKNYSEYVTPKPGDKWLELTNEQRISLIKEIAKDEKFQVIIPERTLKNGHVLINFKEPVGSSMRSTLLLDYEKLLKDNIDDSITVWCEPLGDKNTLRNKFRGLEMKL